MVIDRNSWHYKTQYWFFENDARSLCSYFWRLVVIVFFMGPFFFGVVCPVANLFVFLPLLLFGWIPVAPLPWCVKSGVQWRNRFHLFAIRGVKIYPAYFVLASTFLWLLHECGKVPFLPIVLLAIVGFVIVAFVVGVFIFRTLNSEMFKLTTAYLKAWKDGVCPMIEYVGEKPGGEKSDTPATAS